MDDLWVFKRPSETNRGLKWLGNFPDEDQVAARMLVDNVRIISSGQVASELRREIPRLITTGAISGRVAAAAVVSMEDLPELPPGARHVAYATFAPNEPISATPGSEGIMGNLVRDLCRTIPQMHPMPPTIEELRDLKCDSLLLVTDQICSGRQVEQYARALVRNPTIRSWRSGSCVDIHVVAFAGSATAIAQLEARGKPVDFVYVMEAMPTTDDRPWSLHQREEVQALCIQYAQRKDQALGFRGAGALFATEAGVSNTVPDVLRRRGGSWEPFFEGRTMPDDLILELGDYSPSPDSEDLRQVTGQQRMERALAERQMRPRAARMLWVLALVARRRRTTKELAAVVGLPVSTVTSLLSSLRDLGLLNAEGEMTDDGRRELVEARRRVRRTERPFTPDEGLYYPQSLR